MSLYGYERQTTPVIDDLANHGIVFERVIAQSSWTKTSMASLWTGTYPAAHGVLRFDNVIPDDAVMPAEIFKAAGYRTVGIWRNGMGGTELRFRSGIRRLLHPQGRSRCPPPASLSRRRFHRRD